MTDVIGFLGAWVALLVQLYAFIYVIFVNRGKTNIMTKGSAKIWRHGRNYMFIAVAILIVTNTVDYADFGFFQALNLLILPVTAIFWHFNYVKASQYQAVVEKAEAAKAKRDAIKVAKDLGLPWVDQLTTSQDEARILSNIENELKRGK